MAEEHNGYRTRQRELILERLRTAGDRHITAEELAEELRGEGVGRSTVYRTLERLVEQGEVRRFRPGDGGACYQFNDSTGSCREHHHLKCIKCGRLFHTECELLDELSEHVYSHHGFLLDRSRTVLYGLCADCQKTEKEDPRL